jgi:hypothetical protein
MRNFVQVRYQRSPILHYLLQRMPPHRVQPLLKALRTEGVSRTRPRPQHAKAAARNRPFASLGDAIFVRTSLEISPNLTDPIFQLRMRIMIVVSGICAFSSSPPARSTAEMQHQDGATSHVSGKHA